MEPPDDGTLAFQRGMRVGYLEQEPEFEAGATILAPPRRAAPRAERRHRAYHEVGGRLTRGEGDTDRLLARQGELAARIDALGGWDYEHRMEAILTRLQVDRWERPVEG
jgi:ATPase subunit of ABC transporter with duplicated ATPase domains